MRLCKYAAASSVGEDVGAAAASPICCEVLPGGASNFTLSNSKGVLSEVLPTPAKAAVNATPKCAGQEGSSSPSSCLRCGSEIIEDNHMPHY